MTWGQAMVQVTNSIIQGFVDMILEYTLFHWIRMGLDQIFHHTVRANTVATAAVSDAAITSTAAVQAGAAGTVAAAGAPAAAATSIWSWGTSATIGLALALAAIGAIVGALAFQEGGLVPGAPSNRDNRIATIATGEYVIPAHRVAQFGVPFFDNLREGRFPHFDAGGLVPSGPGSMLATNNVNVSPAAVHVAILNSRSELAEFLKSREGQKVIVNGVKANKHELGIRS
ncbi:MAG: hypothetical protein WC718_19315 [Phycisphaerales bacterium]|jgi:hypothetical protein